MNRHGVNDPMETVSLSSSLSQVMPSRIRQLADVAFGMENVLRLHFGESDMPTPQFIKDAAVEALKEGYTYYTENAGLPGLREAVAEKYRQLHGVKLNPGTEIVITASGVQALNVAIRCVIDPGQEAIVLTPNWPNATAIVSLYGGIPREITFRPMRERFTIDFEALENQLSPKTRLLIYASPSNPLGWVASVDEQTALLEFCRRHGLWLLADEVYERIYYSGTVAPSILRLCSRSDAVISIQSFSKSYCMTGWRLGWLVAREDLAKKAAQLNEFIVSHAPSMVQRAGQIALEQGDRQIDSMVQEIRDRVSFCYNTLLSVKSLKLPKPEGAFYLFPKIDGVTDSFSFALSLLKETRVSLAPGVAFGKGGEGSVRVCCAADRSILEPAMERMTRFLDRI
ncbi:MAG: aminotransferase class I/II-fold pyridoxal phosphate-dependent enzyme [Desulfobacteraceae bacterium]|nr:MAG: aminotransferase class I/II-fold pyridoxal phosphate-dependent enzyme [Desulfobacteraceae bacterium]